jgi:hypothetical protein
MKRALLLFLAASLACQGGEIGGAAVGQVVLPQTAGSADLLRVRVLDGFRLGLGCASSLEALRASTPLVVAEVLLASRAARVDNIPVGDGRVFFFEALSAGSLTVVAVGCKDGVRIEGGGVTDLGQIVLHPAPQVDLFFEPTPVSGSVGDPIRLEGRGFPNVPSCVEVTFSGKDSTGRPTRRPAEILSASPTTATVRVPLGALSGVLEARVLAPCAEAPLERRGTTVFRVVPTIRSVVYPPAVCRGDGGVVPGARSGAIVELRGDGFSPVAAENRVQLGGLPAFRALWAAAGQTEGPEKLDRLRFAVPRGLPAGLTSVAVSVENDQDPNPSLSAAVSFRVLPTLREVRPPFAPAGGTLRLDVEGTSSSESDNLITFRYLADGGVATSLTFPTLVEGNDLAVLVPNNVQTGTVAVEVAGECSEERPFFRANALGQSDRVEMPGAPGAGATLVFSPTGTHVGGVLGQGQDLAFLQRLRDPPQWATYRLADPTGPAFSETGDAAYFLERGTSRLHRVLLSEPNRSLELVPLSPALGTLAAGAPLLRRGRFLYTLATDNIVRIDPESGVTTPVLGPLGCVNPGAPTQLVAARALHGSPSVDLLVAVQGGGLLPTSTVVVQNPSGPCVAAKREIAPTAVAFAPAAPAAYLVSQSPLSSRESQLSLVFFRQVPAPALYELVTVDLPATLPLEVQRLLVSPDGNRMFVFSPTTRSPVRLNTSESANPTIEIQAVDLAQGGVTIALTERARTSFGAIATSAVQISSDSQTLYIPAIRADLGTPGREIVSRLFHVDVEAFLRDTQGTGLGVSATAYGKPGQAYASALSPDGASLFVLALDSSSGTLPVLTGNLYRFSERPRGPFSVATLNDEFYLDAALSANDARLLTLFADQGGTYLRVHNVGAWTAPSVPDLLLPGFGTATRLFSSPANDVALVVDTGPVETAGPAGRPVCILRNLSQETPRQCPVIPGAGPAERVEFIDELAILHSLHSRDVTVLNLAAPAPVPAKLNTAAFFTDVVGIPGTSQVFLLHSSFGEGPSAISLFDLATRATLGFTYLSGTPGLASLAPAGKRLLVPLVDSPFVDLVSATASGPEAQRLATFGGIHLASVFLARTAAPEPAPELVALAFDVLRDGLTRFSFAESTVAGGATLPGYAAATSTLPIDRSAPAGLTDADAQMIDYTVGQRLSPLVLSASGGVLWVNTGERGEVVALDAVSEEILARVPLSGSRPQPRQILPTRDGKLLLVRDVRTGVLHVVDTTALGPR